MELVLKIISIGWILDLILTSIWIYRWKLRKRLKRFKKTIPIKLIEANPIIRKAIEDLGIILGLVMGFWILFLIQIGLGTFHIITALIVIAIQTGAIIGHIKNNLNTSNDHIDYITSKYNKKLEETQTK